MDRDDLLLRAIAEGATTSAALAARTGLSPASVWRGLRRLMGSSQGLAAGWRHYRSC
jgi:DNA-binding IclR family transcriptional regulator